MRQKELRIALVCYGGISLAVYMHGVTKELWKLARASQAFLSDEVPSWGTEAVYIKLLEHLREHHGLRLRVLNDIVTGASAGGINGVFLAQAIHSLAHGAQAVLSAARRARGQPAGQAFVATVEPPPGKTARGSTRTLPPLRK